MKENIKKIMRWFDNKKLAAISGLLFVLSMIPVFYLCAYARPSGDDYGYAVYTHAAWLETHSVWEVIKASVYTVQHFYQSWNGDWVTVFLFSFMPDTFGPGLYWIGCVIMILVMVISTMLFLHEIFVKVLKIPKEDSFLYSMLILFLSYQFIPSGKIGVYWYVGAVHYILPHAAALIGIVCIIRFLRNKKISSLLGTIFCAVFTGGSSYFSSLALFIVLFFAILLYMRKDKKVLWLLTALLAGGISFVIQCISPGNTVRGGSDFGFHIGRIFETIGLSIIQSIEMIGNWAVDKTWIFLVFILFAVLAWESMKKSKADFSYRLPGVFILIMYGIYSAMFAAVIYSGVEVSQGPITIQFFTFILVTVISILYFEGWLVKRKGKMPGEYYRIKIAIPAIVIVGIISLLVPGLFGDTLDKQIWDYVSTGQADDFKAQFDSQLEILLDDSVKEAYLCPINDEQGPLMHMPVTANEDDFTSWVVKNFYNKDKVVMIEEGSGVE